MADLDQRSNHATLLARAKGQHAAYPQYQGYFDTWVLGRATRTIRTKGGLQAYAGHLVLMNPEAHEERQAPELTGSREFWSNLTGHCVLVKASDLELVISNGTLVGSPFSQ